MARVDRRTFLKRVGVLSVATATGAALPAVPLTAEVLGLGPANTGPTWRKAPCPLCGVGCGLLVGVERGRAVAVRGDPDSPVSSGLACAKGYHAVEALYGPDRITRAMVRSRGGLTPVPLADALDLVAQRIQDTRRRHGAGRIALYGAGQRSIPDAYVASKLFRGALGATLVETSTALQAGSALAGFRRAFGLDGSVGCYDDIEHADTFVLWDANLAETDPVLFSRMLARRRQSPAVRIVDLATRTTRTSYASDRSLLFAPDSATAVANGIGHELVKGGLVQRDFLSRFVAFKREPAAGSAGGGTGAYEPADATWEEYVAFLSAYTGARVEALSGLAASNLRWLASLYGDPMRNVMSVWNAEAGRNGGGTAIHNLLCNLHLLVGKIAAPGNGPLYLAGHPNMASAVDDAGALANTLPRGQVEHEADRRRAAQIWGVPPERLGPGPAPAGVALFDALERGEIRFLWIQTANPMLSLPDAARYRRAAARKDCFIVVSEAYPTPTTDVADVILPAALWIEQDGIFANNERRTQHHDRMVEPPGDAASGAGLMIEVARRLGFERLFPYEPGRLVEQVWEEYGRFHADSPSALPPLSTLRTGRGTQWPYANPRGVPWRYSTAYDPGADGARGGYDFYGHQDHRAWIWLLPHQPALEQPSTTYPFRLVTGRVLEHSGGGAMTRRITTLHHALPHAYAELNRDDAKSLGIANREMVRVTSRRGSLQIEARIEYRSQPPRGQVFIPDFDEAHPVNLLTSSAYDPRSGEPAGGCAVRVERLPGERGP